MRSVSCVLISSLNWSVPTVTAFHAENVNSGRSEDRIERTSAIAIMDWIAEELDAIVEYLPISFADELSPKQVVQTV